MFECTFSKFSFLLSGIAAVACCSTVMAQTSNQGLIQTAPSMVPTAPAISESDMQRSLELSTGYQNLTAGLGSWRDLSLKGTYGLPSHLLQGEISTMRRFNQNGVFVGLSDTYTFNEDWYGNVAAGFGDGAFYLPKYRVNATLYKKWSPQRNLVTSIGAGKYKAPDGHVDNSLALGVVYYFDAPWVAEFGLSANSSNPGAIKTQQQFLALTYGRAKENLVTVRHAWGNEGYQTIATNAQLVNFASKESSVSWRHWFAPRTGVSLSANRYANPFYIRSGMNIGIFHDF
jgi:YaiO family outer membrane protein